MKLLSIITIGFLLSILTGCGSYYHYGLKIGSSNSVLPQDDSFYQSGNYEFKSVLFSSEDNNLIISIQHPLHPLPETEKFISQIEFKLINPNIGQYTINSISFSHDTKEGTVITPVEQGEIKDTFHFLEYRDTQLPKEIVENVRIKFTYKGVQYTVEFSEIVKRVKRWSKMSVLLAS